MTKGRAMAKLVEGKVVVVTGAGRGIGAAIARLMAQHGAKVVVNDIGVSLAGEGGRQTPAQRSRRRRSRSRAARRSRTATASPTSHAPARSSSAAWTTFGRIDCVVNNAGILRDVIFHKMTEDDWDAVINVMLKGAFNMSPRTPPTITASRNRGSLRAHDLDLGPDRRHGPGQLRRRQAGPRRVVEERSRSTCRASTSAPTASRPSHGRA